MPAAAVAPRPARLWVSIAPQPRVLVPRDHVLALPQPRVLPVHRSDCVQGAEPGGAWVVRAAVRLPLAGGPDAFPQGSRWMGALHARWLGYMGLPALSLYNGPLRRHWAGFVARAPGDVLADGRKMTSVTERRHNGEAVLVASTLLLTPPWELVCRAAGATTADAPAVREASLAASALLPMLDPHAWAAHLRRMLHLSLALGELLNGGLDAA